MVANSQTFVHVSQVIRHPGDRIAVYDLPPRYPALWPRLVQTAADPIGFRNTYLQLMPTVNLGLLGSVTIEVILEVVRREHYATLPSRLESAFASRSPLDALRFSYTYRAGLTNLYYDVKPDGAVYFADMALVNRGYQYDGDPLAALQNQRARAERYWQSVTPDDHPNFIIGETLLPGGATVVGTSAGLVPPS